MSRNNLVSKLFEQEFNKEENYKEIMKKIHDKEEKKEKWIKFKKFALLPMVLFFVFGVSIIFMNYNRIYKNPELNESSVEEDVINVNSIGELEEKQIDVVLNGETKLNPNIYSTVFEFVEKVDWENLQYIKQVSYGGFVEQKFVEYLVSYSNKSDGQIVIDLSSTLNSDNYFSMKYNDAFFKKVNETIDSIIKGQKMKIINYQNEYYIFFTKDDLLFNLKFQNLSFDEVKSVINSIINTI